MLNEPTQPVEAAVAPTVEATIEKGSTEGNVRLDFLQKLMYALVVVLFIGFAGMFVATAAMLLDAWNNKTANYVELRGEIKEQNYKIDNLADEIFRTKKNYK